jgi:lysophospholipase L1-like esterase
LSKKIKLVTQVETPLTKVKIHRDSKILTIGSCFSDHIGNRLLNHSFNTLVNPFGTIFNPVSISKILNFALNNHVIFAEDLNKIDSRFFHYDFHSSFDNTNAHEVVAKIEFALSKVRSFIKSTDLLVLTFGTSIVYELISENKIVSNCHKVPNNNFRKLYLTIEMMEEEISALVQSIRAINPALQIILSVSPVRHTKEGLVENSLSKSRLIELCHRLTKTYEGIEYFPAYEIMIDELRDYRYYNIDLIHPSEMAIDIIWNRVMESYFDDISKQKVNEIGDLILAKNHIPFDSKSKEHSNFKRNQIKKIEEMKNKYPEVDFFAFEQFFNL